MGYRCRWRFIGRNEKNHPNELKAVFENLSKYVSTLEKGVKPVLIQMGCIHPEKKGAISIDQRGQKGRLMQTRLYLFADETTQTLHLITLGDKRTQSEDIKECNEYIEKLRKENK
jgi:hypothetical protein